MNEQIITNLLDELNATTSDILASALVSTDGLTIASTLQRTVDPDRVGGISAALLALGNRATKELSCGRLDQVMVKGDNGYILAVQAGEEAVLLLTAKEDAKLGMLLIQAKRTAKRIAEMKQLNPF